MNTPLHFSGILFAAAHPGVAFWQDGQGNFQCPSLPDLTDDDLAACVDIEGARKAKIAQVDAALAANDTEAIRPLRAIAAGTATDADRSSLATTESRAVDLRAARASLVASTTIAQIEVVTW